MRRMSLVAAAAAVAVVALVALDATPVVEAEPAWGATCLTCHGVQTAGTIAVVAYPAVSDPDEGATGAPDRGPLPTFNARPGDTVALSALVSGLEPGDTYAVEVHRLRYPGVVASGTLTYGEDCAWASWGAPGRHLTDPERSYVWGAGPALFELDLALGADAALDSYDLLVAVAGRKASTGELFSSEAHFYLAVVGEGLFADGFESGDTSRWSDTVGRGR